MTATVDTSPHARRLRAAVLAVSVLDDVDLTPLAAGVRLDGHAGGRSALVPWPELEALLGDHDPAGPVARRRLSLALRLHQVVAGHGRAARLVLEPAARLLALPPDHAGHLGLDWIRTVQLGLTVSCGIGVVGLLGDPDEVVPLPPGVARAAGLDVDAVFASAQEHAERMGELAARRLLRDHGLPDGPGPARRRPSAQAVVRPVGGVDALSLLTTSSLRRYLATEDGSGLRAVSVPMRSRAWYDLARIDPAYTAAAWSATDEWDRGLRRPVLLTVDELSMAPAGGDVVAAGLADPATATTWHGHRRTA